MSAQINEETTSVLNLGTLQDGLDKLTPAYGAEIGEAAAYCLQSCGHLSGVSLKVNGHYSKDFKVLWPSLHPNSGATWNDTQEATERGAYGVALLMVRELEPVYIKGRSKKGTGFDFWLGSKEEENASDDEDLIFNGSKGRVEISGLYTGDEAEVKKRLRVKQNQTKQSDSLKIPAYVMIVEFGEPKARSDKRQ